MQPVRVSFLTETLFVAVIEKKVWASGSPWGYHVLALSSDTTKVGRLLSAKKTKKRKASSAKPRATKKPAPSLSSGEESSAASSTDGNDDEDTCDSGDDVASHRKRLMIFVSTFRVGFNL